jgi:tetratricopeptide (TPR) repeat protein
LTSLTGIIYFKRKQFAAAKIKFQKAIELQKDNCLASSYYGRCLYELKDHKKAAQALDQAVGFCQRSQFDEPHYYSALTYYQMGQPEKAEARLQEIIKLYPQGKYVDKAKDMLETMRK